MSHSFYAFKISVLWRNVLLDTMDIFPLGVNGLGTTSGGTTKGVKGAMRAYWELERMFPVYPWFPPPHCVWMLEIFSLGSFWDWKYSFWSPSISLVRVG